MLVLGGSISIRATYPLVVAVILTRAWPRSRMDDAERRRHRRRRHRVICLPVPTTDGGGSWHRRTREGTCAYYVWFPNCWGHAACLHLSGPAGHFARFNFIRPCFQIIDHFNFVKFTDDVVTLAINYVKMHINIYEFRKPNMNYNLELRKYS